jgi:predicted branched-subunit amino acid permease
MSGEEAPAAQARPGWRIALAGAMDAFSLPAWIVTISLMGVGGLARDLGFPASVAIASSLLIWAGPGQVIFFGAVAGGASLPAVALAVSLSSVRLMPMSVSILPMVRRQGQGLITQLWLAHYIAATVWVESLRRLPQMRREERLAYYIGFSNTCIALATLGTAVGYVLIGQLPGPLAAGLLFMTPIYFTVSLVSGAKTAADRTALVIGLALAPVAMALMPSGLDLLLVGLVAGIAAFMVDVRGGKRA